MAVRGRVLERHAVAFGHGHLRTLQVECYETDLREDEQQAPCRLRRRRPLAQEGLKLPPGRAAPLAKRPVACGKRAAETVFPLVCMCCKA